MNTDPNIYPIAEEFIAFGAAVLVTGGLVRNVRDGEEANGEALEPSFKGSRRGYEAGQTIRCRPSDAPEDRD